MTMDQWWSTLEPCIAFEDEHGVVHRTMATNYGAMCGNTFYAERAASSDDVRRIAGKSQGKAVTCFACMLAEAVYGQ